MFTDPQTLTISGSAKTLPRTGSSDNSGVFTQDTGDNKMTIRHAYGKRNRHSLSVVNTKTTADPLITGSSFIASMSVQISVDVPPVGYTVAEATAVCAAVFTFLTASTNAATTKIIGGES